MEELMNAGEPLTNHPDDEGVSSRVNSNLTDGMRFTRMRVWCRRGAGTSAGKDCQMTP